MDRREKDNEELRTIQTDLANYLYNHYEIYTKDKDKIDEADKKYNGGNGTITDDEYLESLKMLGNISTSKNRIYRFLCNPYEIFRGTLRNQ
ncbi:hypothetical protein O3Q49_00555 [Enterococcus lactis]